MRQKQIGMRVWEVEDVVDDDLSGTHVCLITAMLCSVVVGEGVRFKFCVPSGCPFDFGMIKRQAKKAGVSEVQWAILMDKIEDMFEGMQ